jgi:hypothetical protein
MNRTPIFYLEVAAFILFLSIGYWVGSSTDNSLPVHGGIGHIKPTPSPVPALPDGERILLLAGVDKLDTPQPQLESLWLLTYYLDGQPIQLLPIYPCNNSSQRPSETQILANFSVVRGQESAQLNPEFLKLLAEDGFWLSGYVLMDDQATASIINLLGGLPTDSGLCSGEQILKAIPPTAEQPRYAHTQQAILIGQACLTLSRLPTQPQWHTILGLIPEHIITDLHPLRLLSEVQILASDLTQLRCEFPSLPAAP